MSHLNYNNLMLSLTSLSVLSFSFSLSQGYAIHVTKSVKPEPVHMKDIITCSGASFLPKMPSVHKVPTDQKALPVQVSVNLSLCLTISYAGFSSSSDHCDLSSKSAMKVHTVCHLMKCKRLLETVVIIRLVGSCYFHHFDTL